MNYFTSQIPLPLAEKLKEKGMPMTTMIINNEAGRAEMIYETPTFASTIDWLMEEKELFVIVEPYWDFVSGFITSLFDASVVRRGSIHAPIPTIISTTWHEAANAAIEKALELIKDN